MIRSLLAHIHRHIPGMDSNRASFDGPSVFPDGRRTTRWQRGEAAPGLHVLCDDGEVTGDGG